MEGKTPVATPRGTGKKEGNEKSGPSVMILHDTPMSSTPRDDIYSPVHGTDPRLYVIREGNSTLSTDMYEAEKAKAEVEKKIDHTIAEDPDADANDQQAQSGALAKTSRATTAVANNRATTAAQSRGGTNETNTENSTTTDIEGTTTVNTQNTTEVKKSKGGKKIQAKKSGRKLRGQIINKSPVKRSSGDKSHNERENPQQSYRQNGEQITASDSVQSRDENVRYEGNETPTNTGQQKVSSNTSTGLTNTQISRGTGAQNRQSNISNVSQTQGGKQNSVTSNTAGRRSSESSYASMDTPHPSEGWDTPLSSITDGGNTQRSEGQTQIETARGLKLTQVKCAWSSTTLSSAAPTDASDDLDDHINVVLRIRPLNSQELSRRDAFSVTFHGSGRLEVANFAAPPKQFGFNVVFEPEATQEDVFNHSGVKKLIDMALNGYACTALAFGQTGSGKTHTMTGPPQQFEGGKHPDPEMVGMMQRSFSYLFSQSTQIPGNKIIRASYLEIYNEQVIDLLNPNQRRYLQVRWSKNKGFYVENLFVAECETVDDLMAVLEEGMRNRQTGSHGLNEFSSRSHSMLTLTIDTEQQDPDDENLYLTKRGKLTFVDLAGSEKVKDSESTDKTLVESNNINRSLLVLGNCISSLGDPKKRQGHIPYRDSKLTKLLADSLGGNGVTLMVACVTPSSHHAPETINTLRYASRAKRIKTKPVIKMDPREKLILSLKREIKVLRNENVYLRQQLEFPAKPKGTLQKENDEKFMKFLKNSGKEKASPGLPPPTNKGEAGLYEMLQEYMIENEALRSENSEMHQTKDRIKREQQMIYRENEKLHRRIDALEREMHQGGWPRSMNGPPPQHDMQQHRQSPNRPPPGPNGQQWRQPPPPPRQPMGEQYPVGGQQNIPPPNPRSKQPPPPAGPKRPPHRLSDPIQHRTPPHMAQEVMQNGVYHDDGYMSPRGRPPLQNGPMRQESPMRLVDSRRSSQASTSDSIRNMNEKLKQEIMDLEGEIEHHHMVNQRTKSIYGSQASVRSGPR